MLKGKKNSNKYNKTQMTCRVVLQWIVKMYNSKIKISAKSMTVQIYDQYRNKTICSFIQKKKKKT